MITIKHLSYAKYLQFNLMKIYLHLNNISTLNEMFESLFKCVELCSL